MVAGPFTGHWRLVNAERRAYTTWPLMIETLDLARPALDERRKSVRLSHLGRAHTAKKHRTGGSLALGQRLGCVRRSGAHVHEWIVFAERGAPWMPPGNLRDDVAQSG